MSVVEPRRPGCPKRMVFGPCGGVRADGGCEVDASSPCVFVNDPAPAPRPARRGPIKAPDLPLRIVTDLHVSPRDSTSVNQVAAALAGSCDAVLVPDHGARHGDFPSTYLASLVLAAGARPWVTLSCRDRNRAALAAECAALADMGVAGVHCVTGDWQSTGETQVFDLDALRLVEVAAGHGLCVSVAASPAVPPADERPRLLAEKHRAGAAVCFVNHCGGTPTVASFVERARSEGADMAYIPCVPVVSDPAAAARLATLPGLVLDKAVVAAEMPGDPVAAATDAVEAMLAVPGVTGVNLSGSASSDSPLASARVMADLGRKVRSRVQG